MSRSLIATEEAESWHSKNGMRPVHPGEVLREEYLVPLEMSVNALAKALGVPTPRINDVVRQKRGITPDTAMRLARYFGGDARSWLNLQIAYDLRIAEIASSKDIERLGTLSPTRALQRFGRPRTECSYQAWAAFGSRS
jgi:antitoxin HigA-1